jgi:hypothetical protein
MSLDDPEPAGEYTDKSAAELLAEATGRPVEEFECDPDEYPTPELDDLEWVEPDEVE